MSFFAIYDSSSKQTFYTSPTETFTCDGQKSAQELALEQEKIPLIPEEERESTFEWARRIRQTSNAQEFLLDISPYSKMLPMEIEEPERPKRVTTRIKEKFSELSTALKAWATPHVETSKNVLKTCWPVPASVGVAVSIVAINKLHVLPASLLVMPGLTIAASGIATIALTLKQDKTENMKILNGSIGTVALIGGLFATMAIPATVGH